MAHIVDELVQETTTSTGAAALALGGATPNHISFAAAGFVNGDTFLGRIKHEGTGITESELTLCTWTTGGIITRAATAAAGFKKSSTGSPVSFSAGSKTISVVAGANRDAISVRTITSGASYASVANDGRIIVDKTVGSATAITLKANPMVGDRQTVIDGKGDAATNNITITPAAGTINGAASILIDSNRAAIEFIRGESEWKILSVV